MTKDDDRKSPLISNDGDIPDAVPVVEILGGRIGKILAKLRPTGIADTPMAEGWEAPEGTEVDVEYVSGQPLLVSGGLATPQHLLDEAEAMCPVEGAVRILLGRVIYEDPTREGLLDTPARVVKALGQMTEGYGQDPREILGTTFDTDGYDEMVVLRGIDFVSLCEHHMLPFIGTAAVGYVPGERVVGLSKLARLVDCFSRRLQIQERMTKEIADAVMEVLSPQGVGVVVSAHHSCMGCRGVRKPGASMVTSYLAGVMRDNVAARAEFLALAGVTGK